MKKDIDIEKLKEEIVERLKPLNPDKIILFGSYAYGTPDENSDIDLFLIKNKKSSQEYDKYELEASRRLTELIYKYKIGFDILSASENFVSRREDYFYKVDIMKNGEILYEQNSS